VASCAGKPDPMKSSTRDGHAERVTETTSPPPLLVEERPVSQGMRVALATLNAPKSLNALTQPMLDAITERLLTWRTDPQVACVVIRGSGNRALCAGGDVVNMYQMLRTRPASPHAEAEHFFASEYRLHYLLHTYGKPVLCWGHGIAMGSGLGIFAGASHRVVTETARLAMPELGIGLFPDAGATWFFPRMPGRVGLYLGLTGTVCNAGDALFVGLGNSFICADDFETVLDALTQVAWSQDPAPNQVALTHALCDIGAPGQQRLPDSPVRAYAEQIDRLTAYDNVEAIIAALQEAARTDPWLARGAQALAGSSPTSVRLFFEQYQRGKHLSLKEAFMQEIVMAIQCVRHPDLVEGIRARIIDKDFAPRWTPPQLEQVTPAWVDEHFTLPSDYQHNPFEDL
jgi:enoyl-CoA hydratase/carnithine racemase